ncbi:MAG: efflux RND transporter periplasmic adaptor subunit [Thermoguttaceae bacterium]|nr:efflux RND transporter periplasmic adaptor subunit [Thermoguttaceae bacterium]
MTNSKNRRRGARFLAALLLLAPLMSNAACEREKTAPVDPDSAVPSGAPRPVQVYEIPDGSRDEIGSFPVFVKGGATAKLSFRVPGRLVDFDAKVGTRFAEGDVVAKLDPRDYQLAVQRVEKMIEEASAGLSAMETGARSEDVASLEAALEAAKSQLATAKKQFERMESLHKDGSVSDVQYDLAKTTYDGALAAETAAEKTLEKANKGSRDEEIEMVRAKIAGLKVDLELARNKLKDAELVAPFSGVVSEKFFDNHETILPGVAILTLVDDSTFEGELSVSEEFIARQGDVESIKCRFDSVPGKTFSATLKQTSSAVQKGNRSYLATISIDSEPGDGLLVGMVGVAELTLKDSSEFVTIPASALVGDLSESENEDGGAVSKKSFAWVVDLEKSTVSRREVKVGALVGDRAQILDGLRGGETIVSAGARFLTDGQEVKL